jgi:hypothetical protein
MMIIKGQMIYGCGWIKFGQEYSELLALLARHHFAIQQVKNIDFVGIIKMV